VRQPAQDPPSLERNWVAENQPESRRAVAFGRCSAPSQPARPTVFRQRSGGAPNRRLNARLKPASAERISPRKIIELDASHASLASQAVAVADLIDEAATQTS
jgi:hypothetical protein